MYDDPGNTHAGIEHADEFDETIRGPQFAQDDAHVLAHREFLALDTVMRVQLGLPEDGRPCLLQVVDADVGEALLQRLLDPDFHPDKIAFCLGQRIELRGSELHLFVFDEAPYELGARILDFPVLGMLRPRQQHP